MINLNPGEPWATIIAVGIFFVGIRIALWYEGSSYIELIRLALGR